MRIFKGRVAVVTGGAHGIGKAICGSFEREGARVCAIDIRPGTQFTGDIGDPAVLKAFAAHIAEVYGRVDYIVNNAPPLMKGIAELVLFLGSEKAGFITGENICADGGMTRLMIYHNDWGWKLEG